MKDKENGRVNLPFFLDILSCRSSCPRFPWIMCITLTYPFTIVHVCCSWSPKILCLEHDVHNRGAPLFSYETGHSKVISQKRFFA